MWTVWEIAYRNLLQAKRRTLLLGGAVAIVACLFLVLRAVSASISERMITSATTLSAGHVNIGGFFKTRRKSANPILSQRDEVRAAARDIVPEAVSIIDRHRGWGRLISPGSSINVGINGIIPAEETRFFESLRLAPEREYKTGGGNQAFGNFADLVEPNTILLFSAQAKKLEVGVGDTLTFVTEASGGQSNTVDLRIVAIASDIGFMSNWSIFVPRQTILDLYKVGPNTTGVVMVYLKKAEDAEAVMGRLRKGLSAKGFALLDHDPNPFFFKFDKIAGEDWLGQKLDLTIWSDEISFVLWVTTTLDLLSFFIMVVLAIIIIGGLMNSMWMSVRERTKEIGTMRAIGAPKSFVIQMFVAEAALLGFLASLVGLVLGASALLLLNHLELPISNEGIRLFLMANTLRFSLHLSQGLLTLVLFTSVTAIAALYPAWKASRLRPVEALMQGK